MLHLYKEYYYVAQISSRPFLTGYQKKKRIEERKGSKVWDHKILHKLCLLSSKLIKKNNTLHTIPRVKWSELTASIMHWDKVIGRLIKQHCTKGTQQISRPLQTENTLVLGLITSSFSLR